MRNWLAKHLSPKMHADAERYHFLQVLLSDTHQWLGEFPDVAATIEWINERQFNHWRPLGVPAKSLKPWQIYEFREELRKAHKPALPNPGADE